MKKKVRVVFAAAMFGLAILGFVKFQDDVWPEVKASAEQVEQAATDAYGAVDNAMKDE